MGNKCLKWGESYFRMLWVSRLCWYQTHHITTIGKQILQYNYYIIIPSKVCVLKVVGTVLFCVKIQYINFNNFFIISQSHKAYKYTFFSWGNKAHKMGNLVVENWESSTISNTNPYNMSPLFIDLIKMKCANQRLNLIPFGGQ